MTKPFINPAMIELREAITAAEALVAKTEFSKREESHLSVLLAKIAALRSNAVAPDDFQARYFSALFRGAQPPVELRGTDILAGSQSITYTQGQLGGYFVPTEFWETIIFGMAQTDPLLNKDNVTLIESGNGSLRPLRVPGWDLSTFAAAKVNETSQQNPQTVPTASTNQLKGFTYRATLDDSFEFEEDAFQAAINFMSAAYSIGFARGIGVDLVTGDGTTGPQGILTGATDSGVTTAGAGVINAADIENIYFSVNAFYRSQPKCAWLMSDTTYQKVRKALDGNQRPLINVVGDKEVLMGKPILISPTMPSAATSKAIVFGDFAHYVVRTSKLTISRDAQASGYVEKGKVLYPARMRADAKLVDPTGGTTPPIVYATLHA